MRYLILIGCLCLLAACGQKQRAEVGTPATETPEQFTARQLVLLEQLPAPDGVPAGQWDELKSALRALLTDGSVKATLAAPVTDGSAAQLEIDPGNQRLLWDVNLQGDYDQNGEVNVSDLTPLGARLGQSVPADPDSNLHVIDGDGNGLLTIADLTPLGANLGRRVQSYNVYRGVADDIPASNSGPNGAGAELLGTVQRSAATGTPNATRLHLTFDIEDPNLDYFYWVRPNDAGDGSGEDGTPSNGVYGGDANFFPVAKLGLKQSMAFQPPYEQMFSFVGSHDPDGTITEYALDVEGDGTYDYTTSSNAPIFHTFTESGLFESRLRVTDNSGAVAFATATSEIRDPDNTPPVADLVTLLDAGPVPLQIDFDATGSSDADGEIVLYEWDFDLDDNLNVFTVDFSSTISDTAQFTFENAGNYSATVRVTDNDGSRSTSSVTITANDGANQLPVTVLTAFPQEGDAPLAVHFNGSPSSDADGEIIAYHWDFDSDGFMDKVTTEPEVDYTFYQQGAHSVTLYVEDNDHVKSLGDSALVETYTGWDVEQLNTEYVTRVRAIPTLHVGFTFRPLLAWTNLSGELYSQLLTQAADGFDAPVQVTDDVDGWAYDLTNVQAIPSIAFNDTGTGLKFTKSADTSGSAWGAPVTIMGLTDIWAHNGVALEVINGNPAVAFASQNGASLRYARSSDPLGAVWPEPAVIAGFGEFGNPLSPGLLNGSAGPQLVIDQPGDGVHFYNSQDANGVGWNPDVFVGPSYAAESTSALVGGRPAVVSYFDNRLWFYRATDSSGAAWDPPVIVYDPGAAFYFGEPSLAVIDGRPAVATYSTEVGGVIYIRAADNSGTAWNMPETVDTYKNFGTTDIFLLEFYDLALIAYCSDDGLRTAYRNF
jgi:PKD repeat protein